MGKDFDNSSGYVASEPPRVQDVALETTEEGDSSESPRDPSESPSFSSDSEGDALEPPRGVIDRVTHWLLDAVLGPVPLGKQPALADEPARLSALGLVAKTGGHVGQRVVEQVARGVKPVVTPVVDKITRPGWLQPLVGSEHEAAVLELMAATGVSLRRACKAKTWRESVLGLSVEVQRGCSYGLHSLCQTELAQSAFSQRWVKKLAESPHVPQQLRHWGTLVLSPGTLETVAEDESVPDFELSAGSQHFEPPDRDTPLCVDQDLWERSGFHMGLRKERRSVQAKGTAAKRCDPLAGDGALRRTASDPTLGRMARSKRHANLTQLQA